MKNATFLFSGFNEALGWTLLNSIWQGMLVMFLVIIALRLIPSRLSKIRYAIACCSLLLVLAISAATFLYLGESHGSAFWSSSSPQSVFSKTDANISQALSYEDIITLSLGKISQYMPSIILCWAIGTVLFMLRMLSGWWYINKLKTQANEIGTWNDRIQQMAQQLVIKRIIRVAESSRIVTPMVIGYLKPIILIPAGMLSGLSTEQLESIFIHELAHIKRHDYLVNLLQSFIEAIFFFNPFVWVLSNIIRREREYCCDDTVIATRGSTLAYAKALTQLEEIRLSTPMLAVSLAENKNLLLTRIKRIMENSAKNHSSLDKLVPAALLIVGLTCASWLTINSEKYHQKNDEKNSLGSDTTKKKKDKSGNYSKTTIITFDENGDPHEETFEEYSGDEEFQSMIPPVAMIPDLVDVPDLPDFPGMPMPLMGVPELTEMAVPPFPPDVFMFQSDTFPRPGMRFRNHEDWEKFGEAFEEKFREEFGDFYKSNEKEFQRMMEELQNSFKENFSSDDIQAMQEKALSRADQEKMMAKMERMRQEFSYDMNDRLKETNEQLRKQMESVKQLQEESLRKMKLDMSMQGEQMQKLQGEMKVMEERMHAFEKELKEELVKDGYVKKGEEIKNIRWDDDGSMEVNGKEIKASDRKKYKDLHEKYFNKRDSFRITE